MWKSIRQIVYAHPEYISPLATSTPISQHVKVDYELQGCPINKYQLLEVMNSFLMRKKAGRFQQQRLHRMQNERQRLRDRGLWGSLLGARHSCGMRSLMPSYQRGCYGCYGPKETANPLALTRWWEKELNTDARCIKGPFANFNCAAASFSRGE